MGKAGAEHGVVGGEWVAGHSRLHPREGGGRHRVGGGKAGDGGMPGGVVWVDRRLGVHLDCGHGAVGGGLHLHRPPLAHHHLSAAQRESEVLVQVQGYCELSGLPAGLTATVDVIPACHSSSLPGPPLAAAAAACASPGESDFIWTIGILASCVNARAT